MAICIVVPPLPAGHSGLWAPSEPDHRIEVVYRCGDKVMRLDDLDERRGRDDSAQMEVERHGLKWRAVAWRRAGGEWERLQ